jgi:hypothetical protein
MFRLIALCVLCSLASACGDDDAAVDAGPSANGHDAATARDAGHDNPAHDAGAVVAIDDAPPPPTCPTGDCDLLDPSACGDGRGCVLPHGDVDAAAGPQCATVGSGANGDACEHSSDCGPGLDCTAFDGTGVCREYCCNLSRTDDCPDSQFCALSVGSGSSPSGAALCEPCSGCDPANAKACEAGFACYPLPGSTSCTACLPAGTNKPGEKCTLTTDCVAGSACFRFADSASRCVDLCNIEKSGGCLAPKKCTAVAGKLPKDLALCL